MKTLTILSLLLGLAACTDSASQVPTSPSEPSAARVANTDPTLSLIAEHAGPRPILGQGDANFIARFLDARTIGNSAIFEVDGRIHIGGTASPAGRLQVSDDFSGFGPTGQILSIHQVDPTGDITLEFSQSGFGVMGNVGVIRSGGPERFAILTEGRTRAGLNLTLAEHDGNVGVGTDNPNAKLDVAGDARVSGNVTVGGNFAVMGTKSSMATLADGRRVLLYAVESPQNWFEDFGSGELVGGEAWIALEDMFAQTVSTGAGYHVFLTPNGECNGLYVAEKRVDGFVVRELGGGKSIVRFDYRIVAPRAGFDGVRLEAMP